VDIARHVIQRDLNARLSNKFHPMTREATSSSTDVIQRNLNPSCLSYMTPYDVASNSRQALLSG